MTLKKSQKEMKIVFIPPKGPSSKVIFHLTENQGINIENPGK